MFGFTPVDESLLKLVFEDKKHRMELKEFNKLLWIPTPEILLATKMKSIPNRTRDEKIVKDVCDAYVLSWYSNKDFREIKDALKKLVPSIGLEKLRTHLRDEENLFQKAENAMGIDAETIKNTIINLIT